MLNPYLPAKGWHSGLADSTGDKLQGDIETKELYKDTSEKFDIYHLNVLHDSWSRNGAERAKKSFESVLAPEHYKEVTLDTIADTIVDIVVDSAKNGLAVAAPTATMGEITW